MEFRIEQKEDFRIVGISELLENNMEGNFDIIPNMWLKAGQEGILAKLATLMDQDLKGMLGVCVFLEDKMKYYIAVNSSLECDLEEFIVPKALWAIFSGKGRAINIKALEHDIFTKWFPESDYEYANAPCIEVYFGEDSDDMEYEVWVPVIKR